MTGAEDEPGNYVITFPEDYAPASNDPMARTDGHGATSHHEFLETRERLSTVEQQVTQNGEMVLRVEGKVDELSDTVSRVEQKSLGKDYFEENYQGTIETNGNVVSLLIWGGGVLLVLLGAAATVYSAAII